MLGSSERCRDSRPPDPAVGVMQTPAVPGSRRVESPLPSLIDSTPVGKNAHWPIGDLSLRKTRFAMWRNGLGPTCQPGHVTGERATATGDDPSLQSTGITLGRTRSYLWPIGPRRTMGAPTVRLEGRHHAPRPEVRSQPSEGGETSLSQARADICRPDERRWDLRSKKSTWLMTARNVSTEKGLAIRNAGSGGAPVRNRSG